MRVIVIGGTSGFIGSRAVWRLVSGGHDVTVFHRGATEDELLTGLRHVHGDRERLPDFAAEFARLAPDVVLDMYPRFERDAVTLMRAFRGIAGRVVAVSSQDVYRNYGILWGLEDTAPNVIPIGEDAPLRGVLYPYRRMFGPDDWKYHYDKIPVERAVMGDSHLPGTVLRLPATYGPGDKQHRLFEYLKRMDDGRPCILLREDEARWRWTHGYVENVADAVALAVTEARAAGRIYNVGERDAPMRAEWVKSIGRVAGWDGEVLALPREALPAHLQSPISYEQDLVVDTSRIREELGYEEGISRDEALARTVAWERANPPAEPDPKQFDYAAEDAALAGLNKEVDRTLPSGGS